MQITNWWVLVNLEQVRGILNKLTPEKFDKLSDDLLCIGLDSPTILKGVILLIFEKALDEPKYSSMYAQLCKRLSEEAPNFEPSSTTNGSAPAISTFRQLLLAKCRVEFESRTAAQEAFDSRDGSLTDAEEEQRQSAKRKMLGNIKFIGELGKLGMLQSAILHMCIQQLLERKRRGGAREMAEDLECLCQIMRTCGRILDTDKAKPLMDQYFDRMAAYAVNQELPSRNRFMLQDVIDLRANYWQPRKIASTDGPRTIQQIREEAARDSGVYLPPPGQHVNRSGNASNGLGISPPSGLFPVSRSGLKGPVGIGLEDVFGSLPLGAVSIGTGPGVIPSMQVFHFLVHPIVDQVHNSLYIDRTGTGTILTRLITATATIRTCTVVVPRTAAPPPVVAAVAGETETSVTLIARRATGRATTAARTTSSTRRAITNSRTA